jgi:hypothetical protein
MTTTLNFSNRLVRTRMPGGVAGVRLTAAPYADHFGHSTHSFSGCLVRPARSSTPSPQPQK